MSASSAICKSMLTIQKITILNVLKASLPGKQKRNSGRRWHAVQLREMLRHVVKVSQCQQMLWTGCRE